MSRACAQDLPTAIIAQGDRAGLLDGPFPSRPIFIFPSASIMPAITLRRIEPPKPVGRATVVRSMIDVGDT